MNIERIPFPHDRELEKRRANLKNTAELWNIYELVQCHSRTVFGCDIDTADADQIDNVADLVNALVIFMEETDCNAD